MRIVFNLFIVVFFISGSLQAEEVVFNPNVVFRCDSLYQPGGCQEQGSNSEDKVQNALSASVGLQLPNNTESLPSLPERPQRVAEMIRRVTRNSGRTLSSSNVGAASIKSGAGFESTRLSNMNKRTQEVISSNSLTNDSYSPDNRVNAGFLYADDDELPSGGFETKVLSQRFMDPVSLNQNSVTNSTSLSRGGGRGLSVSRSSVSNRSGHNQGTFESGTSTNNPLGNTSDSYFDRLKDQASSMLSQFMGVGGGSKMKASKRRSRQHSPEYNKRKLAGLNAREKNLFNKNLLKNRYQSRNIASQPEFGSSQSFLFGNICKHYAVYAKLHRIPNDVAKCPQQ